MKEGFVLVPAKCYTCYLRYDCDEQTDFICRNNDYCKYMPDGGKKHGHMIKHYVCSICGETHKNPFLECSWCGAIMDINIDEVK